MSRNTITAPELIELKKRNEKISVLTAYDYTWGQLIDEAGIDVALVGDSLGMVVYGYDTTLNVTIEDIIRHSSAVAKGAKRAMVWADMPFMSYQVNNDEAIRNAGRLIRDGGAQAVKLEGGERISALVERLVNIGIPVVGHLGLTPQSIHKFGGYKTQGTDEAHAKLIEHDAKILEEAGVCAIVLEKVTHELAMKITNMLNIPTIGIGSGPDCDGQVLVTHDILNMYDKLTPPFAKQYVDLRKLTLEAFETYNNEVKKRLFPKSNK